MAEAVFPSTNLPLPSPCSDFQECYLLPYPTLNQPPDPSPTHQVFHIPPAVIILIIVLACFFLLISYCAVITKWRCLWRNPYPEPPQSNHHQGSDDLEGRDQVVVDHPIWLISTVGPQQSVIDSITVVKYKKGEKLIEGSDCSVCLSEFEERESLRVLPKCKHAFHIDCVDTWLRSHTNCPLCRAAVEVNQSGPSLGPNGQSFGHSRRTELTQVSDMESNDVELGSMLTGDGMAENRGEAEGRRRSSVEGSGIVVTRSVSMDFLMDLPGNPKWSSFRMMGKSSSLRAMGSNQVKRSYSISWSEKLLGSSLNHKQNLDPDTWSSSSSSSSS